MVRSLPGRWRLERQTPLLQASLPGRSWAGCLALRCSSAEAGDEHDAGAPESVGIPGPL